MSRIYLAGDKREEGCSCVLLSGDKDSLLIPSDECKVHKLLTDSEWFLTPLEVMEAITRAMFKKKAGLN